MKKITVDPETQFKELQLGCQEIVPVDSFKEKLKYSYDNQIPLKIKFGADPSNPDLHLGHTVVLQKLKKFQEFGHDIYFLIGDFTAQIGDPTGKNKTRPQLTTEEVKANALTYQKQIGKILDLSKIKIVYNSEWLNKLGVLDLVQLLSKCTVQNIIRREDFAKRIKSETPIHMHEFLYPIFQGYDSVALEADVELGGTDQTFNLLTGRDLQRAYGQKHQQAIVTLPLLEGLDGVKKMSKSSDNYISINESAENIFGKMMSISDVMMKKYYRLLSRRGFHEIEKIVQDIEQDKIHPMEAKKQLAQEITSFYYDQDIAQSEREKFEKRFSKNILPDDLKTLDFTLDQSPLSVVSICKEMDFCKTNSEVRRLLKQNAVKLDGVPIKDENIQVASPGEFILKVGKLKIVKLRVQ